MKLEALWTAGLLLGDGLSGVLLLATVTVIKVWECWRTRHWIAVRGKAIRSEVTHRRLKGRRGPSDKQVGNFPKVVYEYSVEGRLLRGERISVFYDPRQPANAVLDPAASGVQWFWLSLPWDLLCWPFGQR